MHRARSVSNPLLLVLLLAPSTAFAATDGYLWRDTGDTLFALGWEGATPMRELRSAFGADPTASGLALELRRGIRSRTSVGVAVAWNQFKGKPADGIARRLNDVAGRVTLHWYATGSDLQPYVGAGVGAVWQEIIVGDARGRRGVGLCAEPQVGLLWTLDRGVALNLLARYQVGTRAIDMGGASRTVVGRPQWAAVELGLAFY